MNHKLIALTVLAASLASAPAFAGNKDRVGQAGAAQVAINPWARSSGLGGANSASARGLEATAYNISGLAFIDKTQISLSYGDWLGSGSEGVGVSTLGFGQRLGQASVIGLTLSSFSFGDIDVTTVDQPSGGLGTFSPSVINLQFSYAREFSNSIYGGFTFKTISEGIANATASGAAFDAGIRYVTGPKDNIQFGIAIRNVGPRMSFSGDGFDKQISLDDKEFTLTSRIESFELPASLNIGFSYDGYIGETVDEDGKTVTADHRLSGHFTFFSNSFGKDQYLLGAEYAFRERFMARGGYTLEDNSGDVSTNAFTGPSAGVSVVWPFGESGSNFSLDYSYRAATDFDGVHTIGLALTL